ncbi:MAG: hypothetical protein U0929_14805 [Planctomycetaceae bacterium]
MSQLNLALRGILIGICTLMSFGCSYEYVLHVEGIALHAADQSPITHGTVILRDHGNELGKGEIGTDGKWRVQTKIINANYRSDTNGANWLAEKGITLHLKVDERVVDLPCPPAIGIKSGLNFYAFVVVAIDASSPQ